MSDSTPHWLDYVKSEPLTRAELGTFYQISTKHVGPMVESLDGTERVGRKWRVLVKNMPPSYWIATGLIIPAQPNTQGLSGTSGISSAAYSVTSDRTTL